MNPRKPIFPVSAFFGLILLASVAIPTYAAGHELISVRNVPLPENGYLFEFDIETWSVQVIAVCRLPPGWTVTAGKSADPTGALSGQGSLGVTWINKGNTGELTNLFLVDISDYSETGDRTGNRDIPPTFKGTFTVGTYGKDPDFHQVPLTPANIARQPADRCP